MITTETPETRRQLFNLAWALKRIYDLLLVDGTQNDKGEWRVVHFTDPLGAAIDRPKAARPAPSTAHEVAADARYAELHTAVRGFLAARMVAFRHDDRRPAPGDATWTAWVKHGNHCWKRVALAEERMVELAERR